MKKNQRRFLNHLSLINDAEREFCDFLNCKTIGKTDPDAEDLLKRLNVESEGHLAVIGLVFRSICKGPRQIRCNRIIHLIRKYRADFDATEAFKEKENLLFGFLREILDFKVGIYTRLHDLADQLSHDIAAAYLFEVIEEETLSNAYLEAFLPDARCDVTSVKLRFG